MVERGTLLLLKNVWKRCAIIEAAMGRVNLVYTETIFQVD